MFQLFVCLGFLLLQVVHIATQGNGCTRIDNCIDCWNPETECLDCADGYWMKDSQNCLECPRHCHSCVDSNDDGLTECVECDPFYHKISLEICRPCVGNCEQCTEDWDCVKCSAGYRNEITYPLECEACSTGCSSCLDTGSTSCTECERGYFFRSTTTRASLVTSGECLTCSLHCEECVNDISCSDCEHGYTWSGEACVPCIEFCDLDHCNARGCHQCIAGYSLTPDAAQCRSCDHCINCPVSGGCSYCEEGYVLDTDRTCQPCPVLNTQESCDLCTTPDRARVYDSDEAVCDYCSANCANCTSPGTCNECMDGYFLLGNNCNECHESCLTCEGRSQRKCLSCPPGSGFGLKAGKCIECADARGTPNCSDCDDEDCLACATGFFFVDTESPDLYKCRSCGTTNEAQSSATCTHCAPEDRGKYLSSDRCVGCDSYGSECLVCQRDACVICEAGFYVDPDTGNCEACEQQGCDVCEPTTPGQCTICASNYWQMDTQCFPCVHNCDLCTNGYTCDDCSAGYWPKYDTVCPVCTIEGCSDCEDNFYRCAQCLPGWRLVSVTECQQCSEGCESCEANGDCTECLDGYTLRNSQCFACGVTDCVTCDTDNDVTIDGTGLYMYTCDVCPARSRPVVVEKLCIADSSVSGCLRYSSAGVCDVCEDGKWLENNQCTTCTPNCKVCQTATTCNTCADEYKKEADNTCSSCSGCFGVENCIDYAIDNMTCDECIDGYYVTAENTCTECPSRCMTCQASAGMCDIGACEVSYYADVSGACLNCPSHCDSCQIAADGTTCDTVGCAVTWYRDSNQACQRCPNNCNECDNDGENGNCDTGACQDRYYLSGGQCLDCPTFCDRCPTYGAAGNCDNGGCSEFYYLDDTMQCSRCPSNCAACDQSTGRCSACMDYFYLDDTYTCQACPRNCIDCQTNGAEGRCTTCNTGYEVDHGGLCAETNSCGVPNCDGTCDGAICQTCEPYFAPVLRYACQDCGSTCLECFENGYCTSCIPGYMVVLGECEVCASHCTSCMDATTCNVDMCEEGYAYVADDGSCQECEVDNCADCTANITQCTSCKTGYGLVDGLCPACGDPACGNCDGDEVGCTDCPAGTTYINSCQLCSDVDNCATCSDDSTCVQCMPGYWIRDGQSTCRTCRTISCAVCENNRCTECMEGFELHGRVCVAIASDLTGCADDTDGICVRCLDGYFLDPVSKLCLDCDDYSADLTSYICKQCEGNGMNDNIQTWVATCLDCLPNCYSCSDGSSCNECLDGFYFNGTHCAELNCDNLGGINRQNYCNLCSDFNYGQGDEFKGLFWDGARCRECPNNCLVCDAEGCLECTETYVYNEELDRCLPCHLGTDIECTTCIYMNRIGKYLDDEGLCRECAEDCTGCSDGARTACYKCADDHYLYEGRCRACVGQIFSESGCMTCQETYTPWQTIGHAWVLDVEDGAEDPEEACVECPTHCKVCSAFDTCSECFEGRYLVRNTDTGTSTCTECLQNCAECSEPDDCDVCSSGYYRFNTAGVITCPACDVNCLECTSEDGCQECDTGYYVNSDKACGDCDVDVPNCITCLQGGSNAVCMHCATSYFIGEVDGVSGQCAPCIDNCDVCSDTTTCEECSSGYCYDTSGVTPSCISNGGKSCGLCTTRGGVVSCVTCLGEYYLEICLPCNDPLCLVCDDAAHICTSCPDGYYVSDQDTCLPCTGGCLLCESGITCTKCSDATYWDEQQLECVACLRSCAECNDAVTCRTCLFSNTYIETLGEPNSCEFCVLGCEDCTNAEDCSACMSGYYMESDADSGDFIACHECPDSCDTCQENSDHSVTCLQCFSGYTLIDNVCVPCNLLSSCTSCQDTYHDGYLNEGDCLECVDGFVLKEDKSHCRWCGIAGCSNCIDQGYICEACVDGYIPSSDTTYCGEPCWECVGSEGCDEPPLSGNDTALEPLPSDSPYKRVGCKNGCWSTRLETSEGIIYTKGCRDFEDDTCDLYTLEDCNISGEGEERESECHICCTTDYCNTENPTGDGSGFTNITPTVATIVFAFIVYYVTSCDHVFMHVY